MIGIFDTGTKINNQHDILPEAANLQGFSASVNPKYKKRWNPREFIGSITCRT